MIFGKLLGGVFGFLIAGPVGAVVGVFLGHFFDRALRSQAVSMGGSPFGVGVDPTVARKAFFDTAFSLMGHVAKADGHVAPAEIALAEALMARMKLTAEQRRDAIARFNAGKQPDFDADATIDRFRTESGGRADLSRMLLMIQIQAAYADGQLDVDEERVLRQIGARLGVSEFVFRQLELLVRMSAGAAGVGGAAGAGAGAGSGNAGAGRAEMTLDEAYTVLGVEPGTDRATAKTAYRKLMSQHHPDKLAARGMPEEMIELATEKTQQIQRAWARVEAAERA